MSGTQPSAPTPTPGKIDAAEATGGKGSKQTQRFRRFASVVKLTADERRRQADAMGFGWRILKSREAVMSFFNTHSETLGGRPLDIAVDSDAGLERVERALLEEATVPLGTMLTRDAAIGE